MVVSCGDGNWVGVFYCVFKFSEFEYFGVVIVVIKGDQVGIGKVLRGE